MSAVTITCSFSCHMYLTDKCNSFGGDIVLQLKDEAKYTTLSDDVTLMYSAERFLHVQQLVSQLLNYIHTYHHSFPSCLQDLLHSMPQALSLSVDSVLL